MSLPLEFTWRYTWKLVLALLRISRLDIIAYTQTNKLVKTQIKYMYLNHLRKYFLLLKTQYCTTISSLKINCHWFLNLVRTYESAATFGLTHQQLDQIEKLSLLFYELPRCLFHTLPAFLFEWIYVKCPILFSSMWCSYK